MDPFIYILPSGFSLKKLRRNLPAKNPYTVSLEKGDKQEGVLLDTFSGDVSSAHSLLLQVGNALILTDLSAGLLVEQTLNDEWSLAADLEEGPVSSTLHTISRLRAFLPIACGNVRYERGLLMDDEGKTRARFHNLILGFNGSTLGVGSTSYLRGYDKAHADLRLSLERMGAIVCKGPRHIFKHLGLEMPGYSAKPQLQLAPAAPAKECATNIIRSFLQVARRNEEGVIDDHDTEFLHDYRVSLRKIRSV
ncbi:MAG: CHAD domain-containing protein, partial [Desulforhopalus sp.]